jgi:hypothetical protein
MRAIRVLSAVVLATSLIACSKTNLTNLWKDPQAPMPPMDNVLVVSLERDPELRRLWEDALAAEFQAHGIHARPSNQLWPSLPDSSQIPVVMRRDGNDGAVITHRLAVTQTGDYGGGYDKTTPATGNDYWRSWYHTYYTMANRYGVVHEEKEARFQIDLVGMVGGGRLVWMGSTTPIDPRDAEKIRAEVAGQVVPELKRQGLLAGGK